MTYEVSNRRPILGSWEMLQCDRITIGDKNITELIRKGLR